MNLNICPNDSIANILYKDALNFMEHDKFALKTNGYFVSHYTLIIMITIISLKKLMVSSLEKNLE